MKNIIQFRNREKLKLLDRERDKRMAESKAKRVVKEIEPCTCCGIKGEERW